MRKIVVLATGGTIATRRDARGAGIAQDNAATLLAGLPGLADDIVVESADVFCVASYQLTPAAMAEIARRVRAALADDEVAGVVVTHGTDTTEETAFLVDLVHDDPRPVVFTGAQRTADAPDADGPRNVVDAITVAAHPAARGLGALIVFDGRVYPAAGTRKTHTLAPAAFAAPDTGALGHVHRGELVVAAAPRRGKPLPPSALELDGVRVDIVPTYPGCDTTALRAVVAAGATGVVLEATGAGNGTVEVCAEVARLTAAGVVVATSTRVHAGPVAAIYGNGGGIDLVDAGAVPAGTLRPSQARILLTALLATDRDPVAVRDRLRGWAGRAAG